MKDETKKTLLNVGKFLSKTAMTVFPYALTDVAYKKVFYHHTYSSPLQAFLNEDFPELIGDKSTFDSHGKTLVGYYYHYKKFSKSKIFIFAHGYGNGHHRYLDVINYLASKGFLVFSYDVTSFDESEGDGIFGFTQGPIDLVEAIEHVKQDKNYKDKDIILMGHSMGGLSVGIALNFYPNISKAVLISSFDKASSLIRQHGYEWAGERIDSNVGYIEEYEEFRFGEFSKYTVTEALKNYKGKALVIHSEDDKTVPIDIGLNYYKKNLGKKNNIEYIKLKDAGHGLVYCSKEARLYYDELSKNFWKYLKEKKQYTEEDKWNLFNLLVDKSKWLNQLNYQLMDEIVDFIK